MNDSFDVAVVGLGPTGAVCAALADSLGLKTLAVERSRAVYDKPRAFALDHEIMRVFEDLGVAAEIAPHTAPFTDSEYYGVDGQVIKRLGALPPPWATSTVRRLGRLEYEDLGFDQHWLVADLIVGAQALERLPKIGIQYCEPARPSTYLIGVGAHRRWELMLSPGEQPDVWQLLARWLKPGDAQLWRAASYRFHALVARQWRRGRVFLAGDAANLTWKLHYVLSGKAGERLLDTYESERSQHVRRLIEVIKEIGKVIGERDPEAARARDRRLLAEAGGKVVTGPRQNLIPPLERGFLSPAPHPANGTLFPKDGGSGLRVVGRPSLPWWFDRYQCAAAIVRPDPYVYGVAQDDAELDRLRSAMAQQL